MLRDVYDPHCRKRKVSRYWSYPEACEDIVAIEEIIYPIREISIRDRMLALKVNKIRSEILDGDFQDYEAFEAFEKAYKDFEITAVKANKLFSDITRKGLIIFNQIHGIILLPFRHPETKLLCGFMYRQGEMTISTWLTKDEINEELQRTGDGMLGSNYAAGIINPIPEEWNNQELWKFMENINYSL